MGRTHAETKTKKNITTMAKIIAMSAPTSATSRLIEGDKIMFPKFLGDLFLATESADGTFRYVSSVVCLIIDVDGLHVGTVSYRMLTKPLFAAVEIGGVKTFTPQTTTPISRELFRSRAKTLPEGVVVVSSVVTGEMKSTAKDAVPYQVSVPLFAATDIKVTVDKTTVTIGDKSAKIADLQKERDALVATLNERASTLPF